MTTYDNVAKKWCPEVRQYVPNAPILLIGTKIDLRNDPQLIAELASKGLSPITTAQGEELAAKINAAKYVECSALTQQGLKQVFDEAITLVLNQRKAVPKKKCLIL